MDTAKTAEVEGSVTKSEHQTVTTDALARPVGYAHAVRAAPGTVVYLAGQTAQDTSGVIRGVTIAEQFDAAARNLVIALRASRGAPEHLVSLTVFVTDMAAYRASRRELGRAWRSHFGRHYPAMALLGVTELADPAAIVELQGVAVVP